MLLYVTRDKSKKYFSSTPDNTFGSYLSMSLALPRFFSTITMKRNENYLSSPVRNINTDKKCHSTPYFIQYFQLINLHHLGALTVKTLCYF